MKTKTTIKAISLMIASALLLTTLAGCLDNDSKTKQDVSSNISEAASDTGRKDGERFEEVIGIEGQEETVQYEHVKNEQIGHELDSENESLKRITESDCQRLDSDYDQPANQ